MFYHCKQSVACYIASWCVVMVWLFILFFYIYICTDIDTRHRNVIANKEKRIQPKIKNSSSHRHQFFNTKKIYNQITTFCKCSTTGSTILYYKLGKIRRKKNVVYKWKRKNCSGLFNTYVDKCKFIKLFYFLFFNVKWKKKIVFFFSFLCDLFALPLQCTIAYRMYININRHEFLLIFFSSRKFVKL